MLLLAAIVVAALVLVFFVNQRRNSRSVSLAQQATLQTSNAAHDSQPRPKKPRRQAARRTPPLEAQVVAAANAAAADAAAADAAAADAAAADAASASPVPVLAASEPAVVLTGPPCTGCHVLVAKSLCVNKQCRACCALRTLNLCPAHLGALALACALLAGCKLIVLRVSVQARPSTCGGR
jgi:hypothetical protein